MPLPLSRGGVALCLALIGGVAIVFAAFPGLDLAAAALFYRGDGAFAGQGAWGDAARRVFSWAPFLVLAAFALLYALRRRGVPVPWAPDGRSILFLGLSLVLGPGLLVNVVLKDHSHRPRPAQTAEFGGALPFRPFYRFDGACGRNCSFVSGEGATAFWCVAPALLLPPGARGPAVAAALAFGVAASLLRMAFGGHYLSDTLFAALFTWLVLAGTWRLVARAQARRGG